MNPNRTNGYAEVGNDHNEVVLTISQNGNRIFLSPKSARELAKILVINARTVENWSRESKRAAKSVTPKPTQDAPEEKGS